MRVAAIAASGAFFALLTLLAALGRTPWVVLGAYAVLSFALFLLYGADKSAAQRGSRRTPEATLHVVALLGGWPGGLVARQMFHHKTRKQPFVTVFWCTVALNCGALAWFLTRF